MPPWHAALADSYQIIEFFNRDKPLVPLGVDSLEHVSQDLDIQN